jgi:DNA-binding LacI/PurR family transcriptional regulator
MERPKLLHQHIRDTLREELSRLAEGNLVESENRLAKRFRVSVLTIREALRSLAQEGVIERRQGKGTFVANPLGRRHVAVLQEMDFGHARSAYFFRHIAQELRRFFNSQGIRSRLYAGFHPPDQTYGEPTCAEFLDDLSRGKILGVAAVATPVHPRWHDEVREKAIPIAGLAGEYEFGVGFDATDLIRQGIRHLLRQGRRKLAFLGSPSPSFQFAGAGVLTPIASAVMRELGVPVRAEWMRLDINPMLGGGGWEQFRELWTARSEKPDGLVITDDILSLDVTMAMLEMGIRIPDQLMVVTHANKGSEIRYPFRVARIEVDPDAYARVLGEMLLRLIRRERVAEPNVYLPFRSEQTEEPPSHSEEMEPQSNRTL